MFWQSLFSNMPGDAKSVALVLTCAFAAVVLIVATALITSAWRQVVRTREEAELKQAMLQRGMSVEDIRQVLEARSKD